MRWEVASASSTLTTLVRGPLGGVVRWPMKRLRARIIWRATLARLAIVPAEGARSGRLVVASTGR